MNLRLSRKTGVYAMRIRTGSALLALLLVGSACELDLENPNSPTEEEVLGGIDGVIALAVGMQDQYASSVLAFVRAPALVTDELGTQQKALAADVSLLTGEGFDRSFGVVEEPWAAAYATIRSADNLIEHAPAVGLGAGLETGIVVLANLYKAMSLGTLITQYEAVPIDVSVEGPVPQGRDAVLAEVLPLLESARADLESVADEALAVFDDRVLGDGFDLRNTIDAMLARYYLFDGQYAQAIEAAGRVDPTTVSAFTYSGTDRNPIYEYALVSEYIAPLSDFVDGAEAGDGRVDYWVDTAAEPFTGKPEGVMLRPLRKYADASDAFPVYLPDEMLLIRAEAHARLGEFDEAAALVNQVRTQASSPVDEPVADLPALAAGALDTEAELITQIAYERRYELYLQGLRWEDARRLGTAVTTTPILEWLPIPAQECETNRSDPCGS